MKDENKTKKQLINELAELRQRVAELEESEVQRKRAEEEPRKAGEEKAAIMHSMSEIVAYLDTKMRILWGNKAAGDAVGVPPEELGRRHCYEMWMQRSEPCVGCPAEKALKTGQPQEAELATHNGRVWIGRGSILFEMLMAT